MERLIFCLIFLILFQITSSILICDEESETSSHVNIKGTINDQSMLNCMCVVTFMSSSMTHGTVTISTGGGPFGCKYELKFTQKSDINNPKYYGACSDYSNRSFTLSTTDEIYINIVKDNEYEFIFSILVTTDEVLVNVSCMNSSISLPSTTEKTTASKTTPSLSTTSTETTTNRCENSSREEDTPSSSDSTLTDTIENRTDSSLSAVIGSMVGVIIIIVLIIILFYVLRRRKRARDKYGKAVMENRSYRTATGSIDVYVNANPDPDYINTNSANTSAIVQDNSMPASTERNQESANNVYDSLKEPENQYEKPVIYSKLGPDSNYEVLQNGQENHYENKRHLIN